MERIILQNEHYVGINLKNNKIIIKVSTLIITTR